MPIFRVWIRPALAVAIISLSALAAGCAGQGLDARPPMFGATCVPADRATAEAPRSPGASLFRSIELMPTFAATCRPGFEFTSVELALADAHAPAPLFDFAMFGASCSPSQRGLDMAMAQVRVADVPERIDSSPRD